MKINSLKLYELLKSVEYVAVDNFSCDFDFVNLVVDSTSKPFVSWGEKVNKEFVNFTIEKLAEKYEVNSVLRSELIRIDSTQ